MIITEFTISVSRNLDVGIVPYRKFVDECKRRREKVEFGMNDKTQYSTFLSCKVQVEDEDPERVADRIVQMLYDKIDAHQRALYPDSFDGPVEEYTHTTVKVEAPNDDF